MIKPYSVIQIMQCTRGKKRLFSKIFDKVLQNIYQNPMQFHFLPNHKIVKKIMHVNIWTHCAWQWLFWEYLRKVKISSSSLNMRRMHFYTFSLLFTHVHQLATIQKKVLIINCKVKVISKGECQGHSCVKVKVNTRAKGQGQAMPPPQKATRDNYNQSRTWRNHQQGRGPGTNSLVRMVNLGVDIGLWMTSKFICVCM